MEYIDQIGHTFTLEKAPKKIVSLVPSQTEFLHYLGLDKEVVGITKFCIHPDIWYQSKIRVGGTKNIDFKKIEALNPDFIIANKEENSKEDILKLQKLYPVYTSDIINLEDAYKMIQDIGDVLDYSVKSNELIQKLKIDFNSLNKTNKRIAYCIWYEPLMVVGGSTFIDSLLNVSGFKNVFNTVDRYFETTIESINELNPDLLLLSSEPFPFTEKHIKLLESKIDAKIILVDGEMFSWYGNRLLKFKNYINQLF